MGVDLSPLINQSTEDQTQDEVKHYAHIVSPPENPEIFALLIRRGNSDPSAQDIVDVARINRLEVKALCGYVWIPERNPENYDACPICIDVAGMHMRNAGE
jgi:hypothetical protein